MISKNVKEITGADIDALIANGVQESRDIEYKEKLPGRTDNDKREYLADISAFANAAGGTIIYGIHEEEGVPKEIVGLEEDMDESIQRLENIVRDGIQPRLLGIQIIPISCSQGKKILMISIPMSWSSPHMVIYSNYSRFYVRDSSGKHQMDVTELRSAFSLSENVSERIKRFRDERIGKIVAGEMPVSIVSGAKLVLHLIPVISMTTKNNYDLEKIFNTSNNLFPPDGSACLRRYNLDGFVNSDSRDSGTSYCQFFRDGKIEAVLGEFAKINRSKNNCSEMYIPSRWYEEKIINATDNYLTVLSSLNIMYPIVIILSIVGARGAYMSANDFESSNKYPIDRDILILPDILLNEVPADIYEALKPVFDLVWNACGYPRSGNYDKNGKWIKM